MLLAMVVLVVPQLPHGARGRKRRRPKALPSESQTVLAQWNEIGRKLMAMAEDCPEDKYDYKPTPAVRSFAGQLLHVPVAMDYFTNPVRDKAPPAKIRRAAKYKTKDDVVAYLKKCRRRRCGRNQVKRRQRHGGAG